MKNISTKNNAFFLEKKDLKELLPDRKADTHKYDYGKVLVIAGSENMSGAGALVSNAAIKMGAGVVELATPRIHMSVLPEIIVSEITNNNNFLMRDFDILQKKIIPHNTIVIGPGITKKSTQFLVRELFEKYSYKNWIIDADAISAFKVDNKLNKNVILTPHLAEFMGLYQNIDIDINKLNQQELFELVKKTANKMNCNILLKGSTTFITDGNVSYYNNFGNPGMATAGSGDVLAGIIAANLAKQTKEIIKTDFLKTVALSSLIHSLAGDYYAKHNDMETLTASDIIDNLKNVIKDYKKKCQRNWFKFISILQLFVATGICIYYSAQEDIQVPVITGIDKILHFGAYFIYGLSLQVFFIALFSNNEISKRKCFLLTIIFGFLFAISDEIHQYFVPGRNADILDLLVDWCGISLSLLCFYIIKKVYYGIYNK